VRFYDFAPFSPAPLSLPLFFGWFFDPVTGASGCWPYILRPGALGFFPWYYLVDFPDAFFIPKTRLSTLDIPPPRPADLRERFSVT